MERKKFLQRLALGTAGTFVGVKSLGEEKKSTYDRLMEQVGFNHLPLSTTEKTDKTMKTVLHKASTRGHANHGWLNSYHSFSFARYYNPERMNFGVLRVLNDDTVAGGQGFGTHPHDNMEIISIPLAGDLEHKDSMGTKTVIREGDVQVMSAGTGVYHSEYNKNKDQEVKFLQIWMFPNQKNVSPRYDQITLDESKMEDNLLQILSPNKEDEGVWVHQNAWFHLGKLKAGKSLDYNLKAKENGLYVFVLEGDLQVGEQSLNPRDGYGVWDTEKVSLTAQSNARVLLMDVPMR